MNNWEADCMTEKTDNIEALTSHHFAGPAGRSKTSVPPCRCLAC
jgi:hypothetical protein